MPPSVLDEKLNKCTLPLVDRRLAARLVYDTLEHLLTLDYALNSLMAKPDTDIKLRNVLRLGACQILLEDRIPESAACNTSVALCKELGMEGLAGVCNGILRNLVRQKDEIKYPDMETEPVKALSIRYSVPEWLVERLLADWGEDAEKLMGFHQPNAAITIRPNLMKMDEAAFEQFLGSKVWEKEKGMLPFSWRIRNMAEIAHDAGFVGGKLLHPERKQHDGLPRRCAEERNADFGCVRRAGRQELPDGGNDAGHGARAGVGAASAPGGFDCRAGAASGA